MYRNAVYISVIPPTLSFTAVDFREISSTAALMKLQLTIEIQMTTVALSPSMPARGRESSRPSTLPPISHGLGVGLELPWSIYFGVWGCDELKTGHVTGTLVQRPTVPVYFQQLLKVKIKSQSLSGRVSFSTIREGKPPSNQYIVQFQQLSKSFNIY